MRYGSAIRVVGGPDAAGPFHDREDESLRRYPNFGRKPYGRELTRRAVEVGDLERHTFRPTLDAIEPDRSIPTIPELISRLAVERLTD